MTATIINLYKVYRNQTICMDGSEYYHMCKFENCNLIRSRDLLATAKIMRFCVVDKDCLFVHVEKEDMA